MLTDDDLDRRLTTAGAAWRDQNAQAAAVEPPRASRTRSLIAAGLAAAVVAGVAVTISLTHPNGSAPSAARPLPTSNPAKPTLQNTTWLLTRVYDTPLGPTVVSRPTPSLRITGRKVLYTTGYQSFSGTAGYSGHSLNLKVQSVDQLRPYLGKEPAWSQSVRRVLPGMSNWSIGNSQLVVSKGATVLVYRAQRTTNAPLSGTAWTLRSITANGVTSPAFFEVLRLEARRFSLMNACGGQGGTVGFSSAQLQFAGIHSIDVRSCPLSADYNQDRRASGVVEHVFAGTVNWHVHRGTLTLTQGPYMLTFTG